MYVNIEKLKALFVKRDPRDMIDGKYPEGYPVVLTDRSKGKVEIYGRKSKIPAVFPIVKGSSSNLWTQFLQIGTLDNPVEFKMERAVGFEDSGGQDEEDYKITVFLKSNSETLSVMMNLSDLYESAVRGHMKGERDQLAALEKKCGGCRDRKYLKAFSELTEKTPFLSKSNTASGISAELEDQFFMKKLVNTFTPEESEVTYNMMHMKTAFMRESDRNLKYRRSYTVLKEFAGWAQPSDDGARRMNVSIIDQKDWKKLFKFTGKVRGVGVVKLNVGRVKRCGNGTFKFSHSMMCKELMVTSWKRNDSMENVVQWDANAYYQKTGSEFPAQEPCGGTGSAPVEGTGERWGEPSELATGGEPISGMDLIEEVDLGGILEGSAEGPPSGASNIIGAKRRGGGLGRPGKKRRKI